MTKALDEYSEGRALSDPGLATAPSSLGVVLAVGGTLIDVPQMAKGVVKVLDTEASAGAKFGSQASTSAESTVGREAGETVVKASDDVAQQQIAKELKTGSSIKVTDEPLQAPGARKSAPEMTEEAADRLAKRTYSGGGHEFKVLENGRVVRCSLLCDDADEMLIKEYEDVLRANRHLIPELDHLTRLIASDADQAARFAADLESRLARLRGSAFETGPGRAVGRAEDVAGRPLHETTRYRAGIPGDEGRAAREELRRNMGNRPGGAGDYQAHHIVPFELRNHPFLDEMRVRFNWNINSRGNGIWLPTRENIISAGGATVHRGPHPRYTLLVETRIEDLAARYRAGAIPDSRILREFEDLIGEFENVARAAYFGVRQPGGTVILR